MQPALIHHRKYYLLASQNYCPFAPPAESRQTVMEHQWKRRRNVNYFLATDSELDLSLKEQTTNEDRQICNGYHVQSIA